MHRVRTTMVALALAIASPTLAGPATAEPVEPQPLARSPLSWTACPSGPPGVECASLTVPLDYADPDGPTIDLALGRIPAADPARRIGPLLFNFGGPGGEAVSGLPEIAPILPDEVRARFDLVAVDPRGVGGSAPLACGVDLAPTFALDSSPDDAAELAAWAADARRIAEGCGANAGGILPHLGTDNVVADFDAVRRALGAERISFFGMSYGTSIGARYADRYPERVRAAVLDAALPPVVAGERLVIENAVGYERSFDAFLADCAAALTCPFRAGGDPGAAFDGLMARLDGDPIPVGDGADASAVGQGEVLAATDATLSDPPLWPELAAALSAAAGGDGGPVLALADRSRLRQPDGAFDDARLVFPAVACLDYALPRSAAALAALHDKVASVAPRVGVAVLGPLAPCAFWPVPPRPSTAPIDAAGAPALLVIGATLDTQTPYGWAVDMAADLHPAVLLTRDGSGHTSYPYSGCVVDAVAAYLLDGSLPAAGLVCPSLDGPVDRLLASGAAPGAPQPTASAPHAPTP
jgi:pimeloyl-ACP methyl ester carboxylesterase